MEGVEGGEEVGMEGEGVVQEEGGVTEGFEGGEYLVLGSIDGNMTSTLPSAATLVQ